MSYGLSFSDEFYYRGELDSGQLELNSRRQPVTLFSAIALLIETPSRDRARLCASFRCKVEDLDVMAILDRAREIDTCDSIGRNGVPVYLTAFDAGWGLKVTVYEQDRDCEAAQ